MNNEVIALLITVILGCVGIVNAIVVTKLKVDDEVMWAKFELALDNALKNMDAVIVQKSTLCSWAKNKKVEIAREIFEDVEKHLKNLGRTGYVGNMSGILAELKKKYLGEDINAPTKESEGEG